VELDESGPLKAGTYPAAGESVGQDDLVLRYASYSSPASYAAVCNSLRPASTFSN
jgi:hypothetical protein